MNKINERIATFALIFLPFAGLIVGLISIWSKDELDWFYVALSLFFYCFTGMGITVGFHRLFTHESFKTTRWVRYLLGVAGSMAYQGNVIEWCSRHADHHHNSDRENDPHSPWKFGKTPWAIFKGFWYAQFGWMFTIDDPTENKCKTRLIEDPVASSVDKLTLLWMLLSATLPSVCGYLYQGWYGAYQAFIWAGLVRLFMLQHVTWAINSYCHLWGRRNFRSGDKSTDSLLFGLLAFGEGFHNGHHAFQRSAVHGLLYPWMDISYLFIRFL